MLKTWARKYDKCVKCGTTRRPHEQHGFCTSCWSIKMNKKYKKKHANYYKKYYKKHKKQLNARSLAYYHNNKPMLVCQSPSK